MITQTRISDFVEEQRQFFQTNQTKDVDFRIDKLKTLEQAIEGNKGNIIQALKADLHKPGFEAYFEIMGVLSEIKYTLKHLKNWAKPQKVATPFYQFLSSGHISHEPLGVVLIIGPWNYPINLMLTPLVSAIASGNCAVLKPSELAPHTSSVIADIIQNTFDSSFITVVEGGVETSKELLATSFDHIFFTGGTEVGKIVMSAAAKHLTPVTLELGGKSPCIVDDDINLEYTAKRIVWGKFSNAGQTCTAPDYLLVNRQIKTELLNHIKNQIKQFYGDEPSKIHSYARIINQRHFYRLTELLKDGEIIVGGETDLDNLYIAPTVIDQVSSQDKIMQEEIFGPILPVLEYTHLSEAINLVNKQPKPLALYFFSKNKKHQELILQSTASGGVCINDTLMHMTVPALPFGGVGASGFGRYHGKAGFDNFSYQRGVLNKSFLLDLKWRYPPYKQKGRVNSQ
ncbi:aldehyde dehydrogenase [Nostoc sp. TCL26-01]|uniref:aldehyde dehydrogenase n=1 Tax=Nostoc sp. TCL26-01 TaxID=2576904 RepID=UPI0015BDE8D8|nr:aldehyde dehydrogenase [Nostoc sp. TCL26-01]QLE58167.1 aldehyde dehydrogenase [Nostoc sp. TCL26-01]